ncbi:PqqD family protein [Dactylosporangium sp. CA-092794]|uniref:PqqD family protein n=1 Tax=Dactylosporangium sp. CA-092794 TaxID=3239929 RepID=UPI003D89B0C4
MTLSVSQDVVWTDADDEVRLYDSGSGEFQTLNSSAAQIWRLVAQGRPADAIVGELAAAFAHDDEYEAELIAKDVLEFIETLRAAGLLHDTGDDPAADVG